MYAKNAQRLAPRNRPEPKAEVDPSGSFCLTSYAPASGRKAHVEPFPDLQTLSDDDLKQLIDELTKEEQEVSYRRRILHGKIDILRAELVNRLRKKHEGGEEVISGADVQRLTDILAGRAASDDDV